MNVRGRGALFAAAGAAVLPLLDRGLEAAGLGAWRVGNEVCQRVFPFAILALGLHVVVGCTGLLHLGGAAFMAIGVYAYAILSCEIYPFQLGFWPALGGAAAAAAGAGVLLGAPVLRLRGDYLAIVTLGFGEIVKDVLKNLPAITKGTQGINPLPPPALPGYAFTGSAYEPWYYLYLAILAALVAAVRNLERSRVGRRWKAIREDELAAAAMGVSPVRAKLSAFWLGAALAGVAGALWASKLETTADPATYDFNVSMTGLVILIVGGLGSLRGALGGTAIVMGTDILLKKATEALQRAGAAAGENVILTPVHWKFFLFGLALVVLMRFRPEGFFAREGADESA
ncbi:MAG: branched-chain amino acid ABC transporter permease [Planctomycetota bacterium]